jgi:hypothetical protein
MPHSLTSFSSWFLQYDHADITSLMALRIVVDALGSMVSHGKMGNHKSIIDKPFVPF